MSTLKDRLTAAIPPMQAEIKQLRAEHGNKVLGECTIDQAYGGVRDVTCMITETSLLDKFEGIRFRGLSIPECQQQLPHHPEGEEPQPEGIFWLMLTGQVPTKAEVDGLTQEWRERSTVPAHVFKTLDALPVDAHPMTQFSAAILALQTESQYAAAYRRGMSKKDYWSWAYEDTMDLLARLPQVAAYIYRRTYKNGVHIAPDPTQDWSGNLAHMLGYDSREFRELMRLYLTIHCDHEGGNVSAHTTHLVGSALSDPYLSLSAGMNGLAGPLHGLANQEVLRWVFEFREKLGVDVPSKEQLEAALWDTLNSGQVIPGYGHAVLRKTDPRYMAQREFAQKHLPNDPLFKLVGMIFESAPDILLKHGKAKNPWPNVDAHSGCLLVHYGMDEYDYYTVLFGVSRALGVLASLIWDRALGLPIERPKTVTTEWIKEFVKKA